jgi:hypothetical protein
MVRRVCPRHGHHGRPLNSVVRGHLQPSREHIPLHREIWARAKKFLLPEEAVTLNVIFGNIRNYLMCAAVVGAVGALGPSTGHGVIPWTLVMFAALLILTNAVLSWHIIERWTNRIGRFQREVRPNWGRFRRRLMRAILVIVLAPVFAGIVQGFLLLTLWALKGGK